MSLKNPNDSNRCPLCGGSGKHTDQCNVGSKVSGMEILEQQERAKQKKKKFNNTRIYKTYEQDKENFEKLKK